MTKQAQQDQVTRAARRAVLIDGLPVSTLGVVALALGSSPNQSATQKAWWIATAVGAIPDFVKDGEDGFLVVPRKPAELADGICRLLDDESLRRRISERLRERAPREFAIEIGCGKVLFERSFQAVEHADAFRITLSKRHVALVADVALELCDVEVVNRFHCFSACAIHAFDLVPYMTIAVLLRQIRWRAV